MKRTLALLSLLGFCILAGRVTASPPWICVEAKDFVIMSNGSEKQAQYLAVKLEAFRSVITRLFQLRTSSDRPLTVMAFNDWGSFREFEPYSFAIGQYMDQGFEDVVILILLNTRYDSAERILLHEYTHVLTSTSNHDWPPWLREGIAEVYSTFQVDGNKVILGLPIEGRLVQLRGHGVIPIDGLIKQHPKGHDVQGGAMFYPESWALAHYLMFGEKRVYADKLVEYARRSEAGADSEKVFHEVFQVDSKTLEHKLSEYIRREEFPGLKLEYSNLDFEKDLKLHPLAPAELQACYGNLMLNTDDVRRGDMRSVHVENRIESPRRRAEYYFRQALSLDPKCGRAYEGYGFLEMMREDYKGAQQYYRQAMDLNPDRAQTHYNYGLALYGAAAGVYDYAKEMPGDAATEIFKEATAALKLKPSYAECYDLLARLCLNSGEDVDEGLRLINSALRVSPRSYQFQLTKAHLLFRKGDYPAARKMLKALIDDDEYVTYKIRMVAQRTMEQVERAEKKH